MFEDAQEKHAKQINEEKECDMISSNTNSSVEMLKPRILSSSEDVECSEHLSSLKEIRIDDGASDDINEEYALINERTNFASEVTSEYENSIINNGRLIDEITNSDDDGVMRFPNSSELSDSTMQRSKSFISLTQNSPVSELTLSNSKSKQYASHANLVQEPHGDEIMVEPNVGSNINDSMTTSMKPPIHPPVVSTKFGISRKNARKHWSFDNSKHPEVIGGSQSNLKGGDSKVQLRREKTQIMTSSSKLHNRLSWNNTSLKMSKLHGSSTNSLADLNGTENAQSGLSALSVASCSIPITDVCVKELANKKGCKSGYLNLKKGSGFKTYKKYWCVINETEALFYICSKDTKKVKQGIYLGGHIVTKDSSVLFTTGNKESLNNKDKRKNDKQFELIPPLSLEKSENSLTSSLSSTRPKSEGTALHTTNSHSMSKRLTFITNTGEEADEWIQSFKIAIEGSSENGRLLAEKDVTDSSNTFTSDNIQFKVNHKSIQLSPSVLVKQASGNNSENEDLTKPSNKYKRENSGFFRRPKSDYLDDDSMEGMQRRDSWHGKGGVKIKKSSRKFLSQEHDNTNTSSLKACIQNDIKDFELLHPDAQNYKTWHGSR